MMSLTVEMREPKVGDTVFYGSFSFRVMEDEGQGQYVLEEGDSDGDCFDSVDFGTEDEMIVALGERVAEEISSNIEISF